MRALNSLSARFAIPGSCLIAALAAACSFDASQLRTLASSAPDGAAEPVAGASGSGGNTASPPDAPAVTGGSGGMAASPPDAPIATGGSGGSAAGPFDAPAAADGGTASPPDAPTVAGGSGGYAGASATGGAGVVGGTTRADAGVAGSGGGGSGGGTAGRTASGGATGGSTSPFGGSGGAAGTTGGSSNGTLGRGGTSGSGGSTSTAPPATGSLEVWVVGIAASTSVITLNLRIDNMASQSTDLSTVTLRYWYQDEGLGTALKVSDFYVSIGHSNTGRVTFDKVVAVSPAAAGADHYLELSFSGTLTAKNDSSGNDKFNMDIGLLNGGAFDVTNDYSYNGGATGYSSKITLYQGGQLVWGVEP